MTSLTRTRSKGYMPTKVFKTIVADRSGSMSSFGGKQYDMAEHLLQDAKKQAVDTQKSTEVTFVTFDDEPQDLMRDRDLLTEDIPIRHELEAALCPRATTKFNDTLIQEIERLLEKKAEYLASLSKDVRKLNPDVATVLIAITDGADNSSSKTVFEARRTMVEFRENGGRAILMAANMDAEIIGGRYGFNPDKAITVHNSDERAIECCYRAVSQMARNVTQGIDVPFSPLQRNLSQTPNTVPSSPNSFIPSLAASLGIPQLPLKRA
ncbi:MAG: hypothetical protein CXT73_05005 [Methanobacteriota archaeon]|nr:MAG: hypothetical protein CXT73_05005 [Euryarchaeota archaeon]